MKAIVFEEAEKLIIAGLKEFFTDLGIKGIYISTQKIRAGENTSNLSKQIIIRKDSSRRIERVLEEDEININLFVEGENSFAEANELASLLFSILDILPQKTRNLISASEITMNPVDSPIPKEELREFNLTCVFKGNTQEF